MEDIEKVIQDENIEFIRMECADMNGISRGIIVIPEIFIKNALNGIAGPDINCCCYPDGELYPGTELTNSLVYRNNFMYPDLKTFIKLPWTENEASIFIEYRHKRNDPQSAPSLISGRSACFNQLENLSKQGFSLFSAFEFEFYLLNSVTNQSACSERGYASIQAAIKMKKLLFDIMRQMTRMKILPETFMEEFGPRQFEITICPAFGIDGADHGFRFKQIVKEISSIHGFTSTFMSKPFLDESGSSGHFNHSLWTADGKSNVFYDGNKPNNMSEIMEHWIAGLMEHSDALMALSNMTPNCYERLAPNTFVPLNNAWGIDNRSCAFRIKCYDSSQTYIENRMPGGAVNPYIVTAGHIIAGLDGINRKLKLDSKSVVGNAAIPESQAENIKPLPKTLSEALDALQQDEVMVREFGTAFIEAFVALKRAEHMKMKENEKHEDLGAWYRRHYADHI